MQIKTVKTVYFSPTQTTKRVVEAVAKGLGGASATAWDLTLPGAEVPGFLADDVAIIGVPVYAGRVPVLAVERLRAIKGNGALAVLVVTYGNRHYDDALIELSDLAKEFGFVTVAGGAFIGEHSFSTPELPVAQGRPDAGDSSKAEDFGKQAAAKIEALADAAACPPLEVPGKRPYQDGFNRPPTAPVLDESLCTGCGQCVEVCPTGAIVVQNDVAVTDPEKCIVCAACTRACPEQGRSLKETYVGELNQKLFDLFSQRREPEVFV